MSDDECIHGLGPVAACTICNGREKRERAAAAETWTVFRSRYDGQCPECNLPIRAGDWIAWREGATARHEECAP